MAKKKLPYAGKWNLHVTLDHKTWIRTVTFQMGEGVHLDDVPVLACIVDMIGKGLDEVKTNSDIWQEESGGEDEG